MVDWSMHYSPYTLAIKSHFLQSDVSSKDREVSHDQLKQWCDDNKIATYIETSAKSDNNVMEAFSMAVQRSVFF